MLIRFVIRLAVYAIVLGVASRVGQAQWTAHGLDGVDALASAHDQAVRVLLAAPVVLAFFSGPLRGLGAFLGGALAGAAVTAPFVLARLLHV